jgi:hypothetical protein
MVPLHPFLLCEGKKIVLMLYITHAENIFPSRCFWVLSWFCHHPFTHHSNSYSSKLLSPWFLISLATCIKLREEIKIIKCSFPWLFFKREHDTFWGKGNKLKLWYNHMQISTSSLRSDHAQASQTSPTFSLGGSWMVARSLRFYVCKVVKTHRKVARVRRGDRPLLITGTLMSILNHIQMFNVMWVKLFRL